MKHKCLVWLIFNQISALQFGTPLYLLPLGPPCSLIETGLS